MHDIENDWGLIVRCYAVVDKEGRILFKVGKSLKFIDLFDSKEDDFIITSSTPDLDELKRMVYYLGNYDEILQEMSGFLEIQKVTGKNKFIIE